MNPNVLGIYIEKQPGYFVINVAIQTSQDTFKALYGHQDSISEYGISRIINGGKTHTEQIARAMFPSISPDIVYDPSCTQEEINLSKRINELSDKYEDAKDCLNLITISIPAEQQLVARVHDTLVDLVGELAQSYKK